MTFQRDAFQGLLHHINNRKEYTIMVGSRQVGKTTLLRQLYDTVKRKEEAYFFSFEDPLILSAINIHPFKLFDYTHRIPSTIEEKTKKGRIYIFIDEIQYAAEPTNFLKLLYDTYGNNLKIIATGSSAFYIDEKFKDSLAGRKQIFNIKPLNFSEYLTFKGKGDIQAEIDKLKKRKTYQSLKTDLLLKDFNEYLQYGGYPEVVLEDRAEYKIERLKELRGAFLKRDMLESKIKNEDSFYTLFALLANQTGCLLNKNELAKLVRANNKIIDHYLYVLQKCFHIQTLSPFYLNLKKELIKMSKVYFQDTGMRNALLNNFSAINIRSDKGEIFENYVYNKLVSMYDEDQIKFWRTQDGKEIDFIVSQQFLQGDAIEVKWQEAKFNPKKYKRFENAYPNYKLKCIAYDKMDIFRF